MGPLVAGLIAGAAGSVALNATTYLDMAVRGRPASSSPEQMAGKLAEAVGAPLPEDNEKDANRRSGLGPLLGLVNGIGTAALLAPFAARRSLPTASVLLGAAAMAGSDVPQTAFGLTDPRDWSPSVWLSDAVPHLVYGLVSAAVLHALLRR